MGPGFLSAVYVIANTGKHEPLPEYYDKIPDLKNTAQNVVTGQFTGQLTRRGKEQMYIMGARLKRHYEKTLEDINNRNNINVTAMNNPRSLLSANLLLAGLLGQSREKSLTDDFKSEENKTKIHESYEKALKAFYNDNQCKQIFSQSVKKNFDGRNTTFSALKSKVQKNIKDAKDEDMWKLYNHFLSLKNDNKDLPSWLTYDDLLDMKEYVDTYIRTFSKTVELKQLSAGKYVKEFVDSLDKYQRRREGPPIKIFAAEEMSFAAIVAALGGDKNFKICDEEKPFGWPKNGAMIIGELHTESSTRYKFFKLLFWDPDEEKPQELHLNNCKGCDWYQYMHTTSKIREFGKNSKTCQG
ncbi:putative acid phosphatase 5 [Ctenocephalides felis]|uniref:putative acid phosphatase 5 n=1 Tax=Ctenocephalides felis TaxID=7515 RepID=UPI000E6E4E95|nr:putative acid phosphatase 5 [Ctenocephalides felis]